MPPESPTLHPFFTPTTVKAILAWYDAGAGSGSHLAETLGITLPYGVSIILYRMGKFCVSQRLATELHPGLWQFPGGRVEPGETPLKGGIRELREETGLSVAPERMVTLGRTEPMIGYKGEPYIGWRYGVEVLPGEEPVHTEPDKHSPWRWVTTEELLPLPMLKGMKLYARRLALIVARQTRARRFGGLPPVQPDPAFGYVISHLEDEIARHEADMDTDPECHSARIEEIRMAIDRLVGCPSDVTFGPDGILLNGEPVGRDV